VQLQTPVTSKLVIINIVVAFLLLGCQTSAYNSKFDLENIPPITLTDLSETLSKNKNPQRIRLAGFAGRIGGVVLYDTKADALNNKIDFFSKNRTYCIDLFLTNKHPVQKAKRGDYIEVYGVLRKIPISSDNMFLEHNGIRLEPNCQFSIDGFDAIYFVAD